MDIERMIEECNKSKREDEVVAFAVGVGRIIPVLGKKKAMDAAMKFIKTLDGLIGVNPIDLWHNLIIFDTLNNAKGAKNLMTSKGIPVGNVVPILVEKKYL